MLGAAAACSSVHIRNAALIIAIAWAAGVVSWLALPNSYIINSRAFMVIDLFQIAYFAAALSGQNVQHRQFHQIILALVLIDFASALYAAFTSFAVGAGYMPETFALNVFWSQFISGRAFELSVVFITVYAVARIYARLNTERWRSISSKVGIAQRRLSKTGKSVAKAD